MKRQASCDLFAFIFMNDGSIFWRQKLGENQEKKEKQRDRKREKKGKETHNTKKKKKTLFVTLSCFLKNTFFTGTTFWGKSF